MNPVAALSGQGAAEATTDSSGDLVTRLDTPLPQGLSVGGGSAVFLAGTCFHRSEAIRGLALGPAGREVPARAAGMPRPDLFEALHGDLDPLAEAADPQSEEDPRLLSYRSGFWGIVPLAPGDAGYAVEIVAVATLADGTTARAPLGTLDVAPASPPADPWPVTSGRGPRIAICMATFEPPQDLLERQVASIVDQTHANWICCISDDHSSPERFAAIRELVAGDERFRVSRAEQRLGHYANFERALGMAPRDADLVALCDQDDRWDPDKLETLAGAIGDAQLVYSDARIVDRQGALVSATYWSRRRNNHENLTSLLIANTVTGAASLMRRDLLDLALPFPPPVGRPYHDHWLGLTALAVGRVAYVDRPLYDYVQHGAAQIGHAAANAGAPRGMRAHAARAKHVLSDPRRTFASWRGIYFFDVCRIALFATVLELRASTRIVSGKRRALRRASRWDVSSLALGQLSARRLRAVAGRNETLGAEGGLARGIAWRRLVGALSGRRRPFPRVRGESRVPDLRAMTDSRLAHQPTRTLAAKTQPLDIVVSERAPARVNVLVPTMDLRHFFGGYVAKLNLARRLAERGRRVRVITVDPTPPLPRNWRAEVESYAGLRGVFDQVEVEFGREASGLEVSPDDRFVASTWWTAHIAAAAVRQVRAERFLYLIQEYEPFTFPMGSLAAAARESYSFPHGALFSSELLREWFRENHVGVYAAGAEEGDRASVSFQNAITPVPLPTPAELASRSSRRLLFYARPEEHASRNMFELGLLALSRAVEDGAIGPEWELRGVGGVSGASTLELGRGATLELLPRSGQDAYARLLREHDVGLALMYTPHPSLVPIEMASAGMLTVTNSFENKTREAMSRISPNLITVEPSVAGVAAGIAAAIEAAGEHERRAAGAAVDWSSDWGVSLSDELMTQVEGMLDER
jgi:glycosyltransferase involved in cell wall biosynthesis